MTELLADGTRQSLPFCVMRVFAAISKPRSCRSFCSFSIARILLERYTAVNLNNIVDRNILS